MRTRALALALATAALAACEGNETLRPLPSPTAGAAGQSGAGGGAAGQSGAAGSGGAQPLWLSCDDGDEAFVRRASIALLGHRPSGADEVRLLVDLRRAVDAASPTPSPRVGRRAILRALASRGGGDELTARWGDTLADFLRVQRVDEVANPQCFGTSPAPDRAQIARQVRDTAPYPAPVLGATFSMRDVILGSVAIDDLSPAYVANVFAMLAKSFVGANADKASLELARRAAVAGWFEGAYLHRDVVCLGCHNAEFSTTYSADPALNRHFPIAGDFERVLFGDPAGPPAEGDVDGPTRVAGAFRYAGFAVTSQTVDPADAVLPWGWAPFCGGFAAPDKVSTSLLPIDASLGAASGVGATGWDVARSLASGFEKLRTHGLRRDAEGRAVDADEALAMLVALETTEQVWRETTGGRLTVAHGFPRSAAARDLLQSLTDVFVSSGFSLRSLLVAIAEHPIFNQPAPAKGCGEGPAPWPTIVDPWTTAETDPALRGNGVGDAVAPLSARTLLRAAHFALGWDGAVLAQPLAFPQDDSDYALVAELGAFQKNAEPGFRGFDFQATLAWELRFGACRKPDALAGQDDAIDRVVKRALATPDAQLGDAIALLEDRLVGVSTLEDAELAPLVALAGAPLSTPVSTLGDAGLGASLRLVCGAILASPQFRLSGLEPGVGAPLALAAPEGDRYADRCAAIDGLAVADGLVARCVGGALSVAAEP